MQTHEKTNSTCTVAINYVSNAPKYTLARVGVPRGAPTWTSRVPWRRLPKRGWSPAPKARSRIHRWTASRSVGFCVYYLIFTFWIVGFFYGWFSKAREKTSPKIRKNPGKWHGKKCNLVINLIENHRSSLKCSRIVNLRSVYTC